MYSIYADGELLFSTASTEEAHIALSPMLTLDVQDVGSLSFTLPPGNVFHGRLRKLKTIVTVMQDDTEIFRGRVTDETKDIYNQNLVYCEGDKAFFADSLYAPYTFAGTVHDFARSLVDSHNSQVSADKQFVLGELSAVPADKTLDVEDKAYRDTYSTMEEMLVNAYGGYLRTRTENDTHYLDWLKEYGTNSQKIEFSVNLLDLSDKVDAGDVFTCLIPLGQTSSGKNGTPLTIESVNGGKNYIRDEEGVALYGEIWRSQTWSHEKDPAKLLETAQAYLKTGAALETLTINAVDMHFLDGSVESIRIGDSVHILSNPHGIDKTDICSRMEIDLVNPEKTRYTFGEAPKTLTDNVAKARKELGGGGGGGMKKLEEQISDIERWARITLEDHEGWINLSTGQINHLTNQVTTAEVHIAGIAARIDLLATDVDKANDKITTAEVELDGINANIHLLTEKDEDLNGRLTTAEVNIDGLEGELLLRASKVEVAELDGRVTEAEASIRVNKDAITQTVKKNDVISSINQTAESVTINASKINLSGLVTASTLQSSIAELQYANSLSLETNFLQASTVNTTYLYANSFNLGSEMISKRNVTMGSVSSANKVLSNGAIDLSHSHAVSISEDGTITLGEVSATGGNFKIADTKIYKDAVSAAANKVTLSASGWQDTAQNTITASNGKTLTVSIPSISLSSSGWSNGSRTIYAYHGRSDVLGSTTITLPTNNNVTYTWTNPSQGYAKVEFTIGGRKYSASKNVSGYV